MKIFYPELKAIFNEKLKKAGFTHEDAEVIAEVFARTTFDGVFSHGVNRFPLFIDFVKKGIVKVSAKPSLVNSYGSFEQWNGNLGPGILNALHCTERVIDMATRSGIGISGLRNTNHWMRAGTYGRYAADKGFMLIAWTNTIPNMPAWGSEISNIGNNPFVFAIPAKNGHVVLDMAMSQYAYGKLEWMKQTGQELPGYGGYDSKGELTKDPSEILKTGRILPTGLWKGSSFSIVLDLAAAIVSGGKTSRDIGKENLETGLSQVFIAVDINRFMSRTEQERLIKENLDFIQGGNEKVGYPGKRVESSRNEFNKNGVEIPGELIRRIKEL